MIEFLMKSGRVLSFEGIHYEVITEGINEINGHIKFSIDSKSYNFSRKDVEILIIDEELE